MTVYPGAIDPLENCENTAVLAIEQTLGINPQGTHASVVARLDNIDTRLLNDRVFKATDLGGIQQAIDACGSSGGGVVLLPFGETIATPDPVTGRCYDLRAGVSLMGFGAGTVIKVADSAGNYHSIFGQLPAVSLDHISLTDFVIDGNQAGNAPADEEAFVPVRDGEGNILYFTFAREAFRLSGKGIHMAGVAVKNLDAINLVYIAGGSHRVTDCTFEAAGTFEHDMSMLYTSNQADVRIERNRFVGNTIARCAIETHNSNLFIRDNTVVSCSTAINLTGFVADPLGTYAVTVKDNHCLDCGSGVKIYSGIYGATPDNQQVCDLIIADNIFRLNKTLWPDASVDRAVYYYQFNTKPVGTQIIRDNLVRVVGS